MKAQIQRIEHELAAAFGLTSVAVAGKPKKQRRKINVTLTRDRWATNAELVQLFTWIWENQHTRNCRGYNWLDACELVRFIVGTGARVGEVSHLRMEDCHPDGVVVLRKTKNGKVRQVHVTPELMVFWPAMLERRASWIWFFESELTGERRKVRRLQQMWKSVMLAAGLDRLADNKGPHVGRHTYATWELASRRRQCFEVQHALGHYSFDLTSNVYSGAPAEWAYQDRDPDWWEVAIGGKPHAPDPMVNTGSNRLRSYVGLESAQERTH